MLRLRIITWIKKINIIFHTWMYGNLDYLSSFPFQFGERISRRWERYFRYFFVGSILREMRDCFCALATCALFLLLRSSSSRSDVSGSELFFSVGQVKGLTEWLIVIIVVQWITTFWSAMKYWFNVRFKVVISDREKWYKFILDSWLLYKNRGYKSWIDSRRKFCGCQNNWGYHWRTYPRKCH